MGVKIYDTLSGEKRDLKERRVRIYVCGPTVYDHTHMGHVRVYVTFDAFRRLLLSLGYDVRMIINITDVEDKIIKRAAEEGVSRDEIARRYYKEFVEILEALEIIKPDAFPHASEHIPEIIEIVSKLIEKGYAYVAEDGVYFHVPRFKEYGKLSKQSLESIIAGKRIEPSPYKRHPADFALRKRHKEGEPQRSSPRMPGRPGWHIECSAMSMKYLGETLDIHGGGSDLIFPHHENEIAQSEAYSGKEFVRIRMHIGLVQVKGEKMAKSLGNYFLAKEALKRRSKDAIRFYYLSRHYRKPMEFSESLLDEAERNVKRIREAYAKAMSVYKNNNATRLSEEDLYYIDMIEDLRREFRDALKDDFNTPQALAALFKAISLFNEYFSKEPKHSVAYHLIRLLEEFSYIFGISLEEKKSFDEPLIELILSIREELRKRKLYDLSDKIRDELKKLGIIVYDSKKGPIWRIERFYPLITPIGRILMTFLAIPTASVTFTTSSTSL